jgi:DNA-binding beta-propeller fold protein YncE
MALAQGGVENSTKDANQVAILHWYPANLTTSFPVGATPDGVVFDGGSIWVANETSNNITKIRPSDGAVLGTFPSGGNQPQSLTFDGANIWVTNYFNNVAKLRASDGATLGVFTAG